MLQIPVSDPRGEAGVNGVTFSVVLYKSTFLVRPVSRARARDIDPRREGPILDDRQITIGGGGQRGAEGGRGREGPRRFI